MNMEIKKKHVLMAQMTRLNAPFGPIFVVAAFLVPWKGR